MKNKKIFIFLIVTLLCNITIFAADGNTQALNNVWLNYPLFQLLTHFCNMEEKWILVARDIAVVMVVINLIWQGIQIAFGTMEIRKAIVSNITKWFLFLFIMCMYPAINVGLLTLSQQIADKMTQGWSNTIGKNMTDYYNNLAETVKKKGNEKSVIVGLKEKRIQELIIEKSKWIDANQQKWSDAGDESSRMEVEESYKAQIEAAQAELESAKNLDAGDISVQTFTVLKSIFTPIRDSDNHITAWTVYLNTVFNKTYISPDIMTRDNGKTYLGKSSKKKAVIHIMSPDAIMKTIYLCAAVMWEREWTATNQEWLANQEKTQEDESFNLSKILAKKITILDFPVHRIAEMIFCMILIVTMVMCGSVAVIQYMMSLLEYTLVAGACAILIPFMLFDGLTDMAQKVISILFQQAMKLIFCIITCTFVIWCYFYLAETCVGSVTGLSLQNFVFGAFMSLIGGAFMTNAPKLASVLTTGTPQMSMGEFMQQAGSYLAAGRIAQKAGGSAAHFVSQAGKLAGNVGKKAAKFGVDLAGQGSRNIGAMKGGYKASREAGQGKMQSLATALTAGAGQQLKDTGRTMKRGLQDFVTGGGAGGKGHGSGGTGANSSLNLNSDKWTNSSDKKTMETAEAHNYHYGQSMHYEEIDGRNVATRPQKLGEHMQTQHNDAKDAAYEKFKNHFEQQKKNKEKT